MMLAKSSPRTQSNNRTDRLTRSGRDRSNNERTRPVDTFPRRIAESRPEIVRTDSTGIVETAAQILEMGLLSLKGYQELTDLGPDESLQTFAEIMVRQRSAQCRELAKILAEHSAVHENSNSACEELRLEWVRALWNLDQGQVFAGIEGIEAAEEILEDAYLNAAALYGRCPIAAVFCRHATNVCGARQRLDGTFEDSLTDEHDELLVSAN